MPTPHQITRFARSVVIMNEAVHLAMIRTEQASIAAADVDPEVCELLELIATKLYHSTEVLDRLIEHMKTGPTGP